MEFEEVIFAELNGDWIEKLTVEEVSLHKHLDNTVTLEAWMSLEPKEDNRWIWVRMRKNEETMQIEEEWYTKDNYGQEPWSSLQECLDYYAQQPGIKRSKAVSRSHRLNPKIQLPDENGLQGIFQKRFKNDN